MGGGKGYHFQRHHFGALKGVGDRLNGTLGCRDLFQSLTMKERSMVPTRKVTEKKVKFSGISEIYPRLHVFQISWEHPDKRESSKKGEKMVAKPIPGEVRERKSQRFSSLSTE